MAKKSMLEEAIAEARQLREAAIQNAYKQLEESLTPSIKEMLATQLEEENEVNLEEEEESIEEATNSGFKEVKPSNLKEEDESEEEKADDAAEESEEDADAAEGDAEAAEDDAEASEEDAEKAGEEAAEAEETSDDTKLADITLGDLKDLVADIVAAGAGEAAPEGDLGADMEPGDVEGMGDEEAPIEDPAAEIGADVPGETGDEEDDEIDISEILKELELEEKQEPKAEKEEKKEDKDTEKQLQEALDTIKELRKTVAEVNLLNGKLLYTTRVLRHAGLSESKKAYAIKQIDKATSVKQIKESFNNITEGVAATSRKRGQLMEHRARQAASKPAGKSTAPKKEVIAEANDVVKRMQYLAGIITED